ncbi:hypothetical protein [Methylobacterium sp. D54C]
MSQPDPRITLQDCLRAAFAATLRGDYVERDRWCAIAETAFATGTEAGAESMPLNTPISEAALAAKAAPLPDSDTGGKGAA